MCRVQYLLFVLTLALYELTSVQSSANSEEHRGIVIGEAKSSVHESEDFDVRGQVCDFNDAECLTIAGNKIYSAVVKGVKGLIDPIDPLYLEKASGDEGAIHYELRNITLTGMRNCEVDLLKYFVGAELTYEYYLHCPQLVFNFNYEVKGLLDGTELNGIGLASETAEDYVIIIKGKSEKYVSEKDQKLRLVLKDYQTETELKGKYNFETTKIIKGDQARADLATAFLNNKANAPEKYIQTPTLEKFWALFMETVNKYLKEYPLEELFSKD